MAELDARSSSIANHQPSHVSRLTLLWRVRIFAAAMLLPPLLRLVPLDRLAARLGQRAAVRRPGRLQQQMIMGRVDRLLTGLPAPWARTCLTRSTVLYHLLRRSGVPVELCIGVRRDGDRVAAHAWLEVEGRGYLEPEASREFEVIARFPASGLQGVDQAGPH